jgi:prepilin-type N-terminal cleavage/methylation domain-containing protein/prepilin-type processing-associated H-X9-DG protein
MKGRPASRLHGFTLLEVLVVLAIVVVIATLVNGAMRQARSEGEAARCVGNLRQLTGGAIAYAADHEGKLPRAQDSENRVRWHGTRSTESARFNPADGPLAAYLGADGRVKECPTLRQILQGKESFEDGAGGYGYNAIYLGGTPADPFDSATLTQVDEPGTTLMFADTAFARAQGVQEYPFAEPWRSVDRRGNLRGALSPSIHFRHGGRANIGWADGRVTREGPSRLGGVNHYGGDASKEQLGWIGESAANGVWNSSRAR